MISLRAQFEKAKKEREDFGSIAKIKRTCKPEVDRYLSRLRRKMDEITEGIDSISVTGPQTRTKLAALKAKRKLVKELINEFDQADEIFNFYGQQVSVIQRDMKKKESVGKPKQYESVPPTL
jgi:hypothetical protein